MNAGADQIAHGAVAAMRAAGKGRIDRPDQRVVRYNDLECVARRFGQHLCGAPHLRPGDRAQRPIQSQLPGPRRVDRYNPDIVAAPFAEHASAGGAAKAAKRSIESRQHFEIGHVVIAGGGDHRRPEAGEPVGAG